MRVWANTLNFVLFGLVALALPAGAADYPTKSLKLVVPYGAGGGTDVVARLVATELAKRVGQSVVVENRPGAESSIGAEIVARAAPDGYTLMVGASGLTSGPFLLKSFAVHPVKDFTHIIQFAEAPTILVINPLLPARNIAEFIALAKANPGKYNFAAFGPYTLDLAVLNAMAGTDIVPVPFPGGLGPMVAALLGNHIQAMFSAPMTLKSQIDSGALRLIAISSARRHALLPDVPTISEAVPGYSGSALWQGLSGPAGLPEIVVAKLNTETNAVLTNEDVRRRLAQGGFSVVGGSAAAYRDMVIADFGRFERAAKLGRRAQQ